MSDEAVYQVHGIGPVKDTVEIVLEPGMNVFLGRNAEGKTTATDAVRRAAGDETVSLEKCDWAEKGWVQGPGLLLNVGAKRTTAAGAPVVEVADYGRLHQLLDPQGKTKATRDKNRSRALLDLWPDSVDQDLLLDLCGGNEEVAAAVQGQHQGQQLSLAQAATAVKKVAEALARPREGEAKDLERQVVEISARRTGLADELGGGERPPGTADELAARFLTQTQALGRLQHQAELRQAREQERLRAAGGAAADIEGLDPSEVTDELLAAVLGPRPDREGAVQEYQDLRQRLDIAREHVQALEQQLAAKKAEGRALAEQQQAWDARAAVLRQPVEGPAPAEVEDAGRALQEQEAELEELRMYEEVDELQRQQKLLVEKIEVEKGKGMIYRDVAKGVAATVNRLLAERDFGGLRVDPELGLAYAGKETDGELVPFERLSAGQQARAVLLGAGLLRYPGRVMPVHPSWWWSIQPRFQRQLVELALEHGIKLVTEWPTDSPGLRVAHLGSDWTDSDLTATAWCEAEA